MARLGLSLTDKSPPAVPPIRSLLQSAPEWPDDSVEWEAGVSFQPEYCPNSYGAWAECSTGSNRIKNRTTGPDNVDYSPFVAYVIDQCRSSFGVNSQSYIDRATRQLEAWQSHILARELWSGTLAQQESLPNRYLASADATILAASSAQSTDAALAYLEDAIHHCLLGTPGTIHVTPAIATLWSRNGLIYLNPDGQLVTCLGTLIIPDSGYPGTSPAGVAAAPGAVWAYGSSMVYTKVGKIDNLGGPNFEGVNRDNNDILTVAERPVMAVFSKCCLFAIKIDGPYA